MGPGEAVTVGRPTTSYNLKMFECAQALSHHSSTYSFAVTDAAETWDLYVSLFDASKMIF